MKTVLTIVIPTHNRKTYLRRALNYYQLWNCNIIVCDSSEESNLEIVNKFANVVYLHTKKTLFVDKVCEGLKSVNTEFVAMCADDDFIIHSTLMEGLMFLTENTTYSAYTGLYTTFRVSSNGIKHNLNAYGYARNLRFDDADMSKRLVSSFTPYYPLFYGLHRKPNLLQAFEYARKIKPENYNFTELFVNFTATANGKWMVADQIYQLREDIYNSAGATTEGLEDIKNAPKSQNQYQYFINTCENYLCEIHHVTPVRATDDVAKTFNSYLDWVSTIKPGWKALIVKKIPMVYRLYRKFAKEQNISAFNKNYSKVMTELKKIEEIVEQNAIK